VDKVEIYRTLNRAYFSDAPHEKEVIDRLARLLADARICVDCGASLGQYTRAMNEALEGATVHAIEADPTRFEELARNARRWELESSNRIVTHHNAVSDTTETATFFVTNSNVSGALAGHKVQMEVDWEELEVSAVSLDSLFPSEMPDFVKIDVEGAELSVLRGAERILRNGSATFLVELHEFGGSESREVLRLMRGHGYRAVDFFGQTVFVKGRSKWLRLTIVALQPSRLPPRIRRRVSRAVRRRALSLPPEVRRAAPTAGAGPPEPSVHSELSRARTPPSTVRLSPVR